VNFRKGKIKRTRGLKKGGIQKGNERGMWPDDDRTRIGGRLRVIKRATV
jgi:hypothetical protein